MRFVRVIHERSLLRLKHVADAIGQIGAAEVGQSNRVPPPHLVAVARPNPAECRPQRLAFHVAVTRGTILFNMPRTDQVTPLAQQQIFGRDRYSLRCAAR